MGLFYVVGADAEDQPRADDFAGFDGGQVFLADVNAISAASHRDIGTVVDDAENVVLMTKLHELLCPLQQLAAFEILLPQLQTISPAGDGLGGSFQPTLFADRFGDQNV